MKLNKLLILLFSFCLIQKERQNSNVKSIYLENKSSQIKIQILPEIGNTIHQIYYNNQPILYSPIPPEEYENSKNLQGIPFLHPWANRLEGDYFYWKNKKHEIRDQNKKLRRDTKGLPIHGLLLKSKDWKVSKAVNYSDESIYESEFIFNTPELLEIFPFPHIIEHKIILKNNNIIIYLNIKNTGSSEMPISSGFHPYFILPEGSREKTLLQTNARSYYKTGDDLLPTGEKGNAKEFLPENKGLNELFVDHVFNDFYGTSRKAFFLAKFPDKILELEFSREFDHAVIFLPKDRPVICIEPMTAPTNAFNLSHKNPNIKLQSIRPGETFEAWYRIGIIAEEFKKNSIQKSEQ